MKQVINNNLLYSLTLMVIGLCLSFSAYADVDIRPTQISYNGESRGIVTLGFIVRNRNGSADFEEVLQLPEGWRQITPSFPFLLEGNQRQTRLINVLVASTAKAGEYEIDYLVREKDSRANQTRTQVTVNVKAVTGIAVDTLDAPDSVIAGDAYTVRFSLKNTGNTSTNIDLSIRDSLGYVKNITPKKIQLEGQEESDILVEVQSDKAIRKSKNHRLELIATDKKTGKEQSAIAMIDIISRISGEERAYDSIPGKLKMTYSNTNKGQNDQEDNSYQLEYSAKGNLDDAGTHNIGVFVRTPSTTGSAVSGKQQEIRATYEQTKTKLKVATGDRSYRLNTLSEQGFFGRGIEIEKQFDNNWSIKTFAAQTSKESRDSGEEIGIQLEKRVSDALSIGTSFLTKEETTETSNLYEQITAVYMKLDKPTLNIEAEVAKDKDAAALQLKASGRLNAFRYGISATKADASFDGQQQDIESIAARLGVKVNDDINLFASVQQRKDNLKRDINEPINEDNEYSVGGELNLKKGQLGQVSMEYRQREREDIRATSDQHDELDAIRIAYRNNFKSLAFNTEIEQVEFSNFIEKSIKKGARYRLSLSMPIDDTLQTSFGYESGLNVESQGENFTSFNVNASWSPDKYNRFSASGTHTESGTNENQNYRLNYSHFFRNQHRISLEARHRKNEQNDETAILLEYQLPLGIPIRKRNDIANLRGKLIRSDNNEPVKNAIVNLSGIRAVTDESGSFYYPSIKKGSYQLRVNMNRSKLSGFTTEKVQPYPVQIEALKDKELIINLVKGGELRGYVKIFKSKTGVLNTLSFKKDSETASNAIELIEDKGLANTLVTLRSLQNPDKAPAILKTLTNSLGYFSFKGIQAGQWQLELKSRSLDEDFRFENKQQLITIKTDQIENITLRVVPKTHDVKRIGPAGGLSFQ